MPESENTELDEKPALSRRDVLRGVGAAGAMNVFGTGSATATESARIIVGTQPGRADIAREKASQVINNLDFNDIGQAVVGRWPEQALQGLERNPNIRYIEKDRAITVDTHEVENPDEVLDWGDDRIDVDIGHANGHTGDGINVAIIDSGIDTQHEDLKDNLHDSLHTAPERCLGCPEDWHDDLGHGTGVAGIVGALHTVGDVIGVAPEVTLHSVKVIPVVGDGFASNLAAGLEWVAENGIDVANMSLGQDEPSDCVRDAMQCARDNDVVLVSSAGNEEGGDVTFPGGYDQDIAVSGITELDELSDVSSTGSEVDIAGPTESGDSQTGRGILTAKLDGGTTRFGGTSAAAPHVTGAAALLLADGTHPDDVQAELENSAEDLGLGAEEQGAGLVDVANMLGLDSVNDLLEVETDFVDPTSNPTEAHLNGKITHLIGSDSAEVFFEYRKNGNSSWTKTSTETLTGTVSFENSKSFDRTITGLDEGTRYDFRAGATVEHSGEGWSSTEHGSILTFEQGTNLAPTASFMHDPDVPNPGDEVEFDASESTNPEGELTYEWDFEDDGSFDDTGMVVTHSYSDPGNVTVRLRVTDQIGQIGETTKSLRVNDSPEAAFTFSPQEPNENETIEFDASASSDPDGDIAKYEWDWDYDGEFFGFDTEESTTEPTTTHSYAFGGEKTVALRVTDDNGVSDTTTKTVEVNERPFARFDFSPTEPNEGEPVSFDASDSTDPDGSVETYEWDWDYDGSEFNVEKSTSSATTTHTFSEGGDKTVALRVIDDDGLSEDFPATEEFYVNHAPTAPFSNSPTEPNEGESISFDASEASDQDGSIDTYEWDFDEDGTFDDATGVNPTHTYSDSGDKTVALRVTDDDGASTTRTKTIHVNAFPTAAFTHAPTEPNEGETVTFDASNSSDPDGSVEEYEWDWDGDGTFEESTSSATTTHTFSEGGDKTVSLRVTDDDGATSTPVSRTFHVNHRPTASFTVSPSEPDEDDPATFDASNSSDPDGSIEEYEWDWDGDGTFEGSTSSATTTHTFSEGGDKTVTLRVTDDDGATSTPVSRTFHVNHRPTASFTITPDPVVRNEAATFDASDSNDPDGSVDTYQWDWDYDGSTFDLDEETRSKTITHTFSEGGAKTVALRVTDDDGATSEPEVATRSFTIYIRVAITIQPDGTGRNSIKSDREGDIPVAVVHTEAFDPPARLDPGTVHFGDPDDVTFDASDEPQGGAEPAHSGGHVEDVDEDGNMDFMFHFPTGAADFDSDDSEGEFAGLTQNGVPVFGSDSVHII